MKFELFILGNNSATPIRERQPTAQIVNHNERLFLIDCGEGTQLKLLDYNIKRNRIDHIFISHLHGDHYFGLVGLLSTMHHLGRSKDLHLYGPPPLKEIIDLIFQHSKTELKYNLVFQSTSALEEQELYRDEYLSVSSFPVSHRVDCTGFRFQEIGRPANLDAEMIQKLKIPYALLNGIKQGGGYTDIQGKHYPNEVLVASAPENRSYAYTADTKMVDVYWEALKNVDLLYHESTFLDEMQDRAAETFHSTARQAAQVAKKVAAKRLLLGHYSSRYKNRDLPLLLEEARSVFPNTDLSVQGEWYVV